MIKPSGAANVAHLAAVAGLSLLALHLWWFYLDLETGRNVIGVRVSLRRLSALTIQFFPDRNLDAPELFWKAIKREGNPMRDVWDTEYRVDWAELDGKRNYYWRSAGPDRRWGSSDDIVVVVPYPSSPAANLDPQALDFNSAAPSSLDAK